MSISEGTMLTCDICGASQFFSENQQGIEHDWTQWQRCITSRFIFKKDSAICPRCTKKINQRLHEAVGEIKNEIASGVT